uniref:Uncharacterized protein n=1 Tax=Rhizophora mucronata TaxID=61149 RepID=A0A2P2J8P2_RHIMU
MTRELTLPIPYIIHITGHKASAYMQRITTTWKLTIVSHPLHHQVTNTNFFSQIPPIT